MERKGGVRQRKVRKMGREGDGETKGRKTPKKQSAGMSLVRGEGEAFSYVAAPVFACDCDTVI